MSVATRRPRGFSRSPGFVQLAIACVLTLIVAIVALRAQQASPPAIAEFAPTAHQEIKQAPPNQSVPEGKGPGSGGGATPTPIPTPTPSAAAASLPPEVFPCVGSPPRQIQDPQSPPCVGFWNGDNGGATYKGVSRGQITVAVPDANGAHEQYMDDLAAFFNKHFEFYGRKIVLTYFTDPGNHADAPPDSMYAAEAQTVNSYPAFASLNMTDSGGGEIVYYDDLAREGILSVANENVLREGESHLDSYAPFEWRTLPPFDVVASTFGQYVCNTLKGQGASHAGTGLTNMPRKFGILVTTFTDGFTPDISPMSNELNACGLSGLKTIDESYNITQSENGYESQVQQDMLTFKQAGVTSILCMCHGSSMWLGDYPAAQNQGYFPEWVVPGYQINDWDTNQQVFAANTKAEAAGEFGIDFNNKYVASVDEPVVWAIHDVDPSYTPSDGDVHNFMRDYQGFLVLASGIQEAGPNLTPQSFQDGLFRTQFPDPGADGPPYYQAEVGFGPSHTFFHSEAEVSWSNSATSTWGNQGAFCWARLGKRYAQEQWPEVPSYAGQGSCY